MECVVCVRSGQGRGALLPRGAPVVPSASYKS